MVSFESSLRLSRRRGWEDAYLDYQSLHLLLTQIEAVYEEEDWKRGGRNDSFAHLPNFDELDDDDDELNAVESSLMVTADDGFLKSLWKNAVRMTRQIIVPGSSASRHSSLRRRLRRGGPTASSSDGFHGFGSNTTDDNNWVSNDDYFDYSRDQYRRKQKRGGNKDSSSHDRALNRGGWRSPGVTDYRDELFLVSDEDVAYGHYLEGQSDEENDDEDDWEDDEEKSVNEDFDEVDQYSGAHDVDDMHLDNNRISPLPASDDGKNASKKLTPVMEVSENEDSKLGDSNRSRKYESPPMRDQDDPVFASKHGLLWTPDASPTTSPINDKKKLGGGQKVKFTDSPGVLEAGYETFAAAAARSGFVHPDGDESQRLMVGSPSEQRGWLGGVIPTWLGGGGGRQPKLPTETDPLLLKSRESSSQEVNPPKPKNVDTWLDISDNRIAYMSGDLRPPLTPLVYNDTDVDKPFKSIPVPATAAGGLMPETPTESPLTPTFPYITSSSSEKQRKQKNSGSGGFGVSLNMIPTRELLHSSSSNRKSPEDAKLGMSQFYSFQNQDYPSSNNESTEYSTRQNNDLGKIEDYDGGDEHELGTSNMISYYSYSGGNDGYFSVRSPTPVARRHNPSHQRSLSSNEKKSMPGSSSDGGIMRYLFGTASNGNKRIVPTEGGSAAQIRGVVVRLSSNDNAKNHRRSGAKQRTAVAAGKRKRARLRKQRQLRRQRERIPVHLRLAHARAATITERFRGLLRAEVEKVILFANSRLGELSDTIGSLRYSSNEDGLDEMRRKSPSLAEVGMHQLSSSDSDDDDSGPSSASSLADEQEDGFGDNGNRRLRKIDSSETKKQLVLRDRLRISKPLFQKADFLGEDFSLLSAVDEVDAYTAVGVELLHLLKYICVNVIAVRKICKKHDRFLANRMLGGYYRRLSTETKGIYNGRQRQLMYLSRRDAEPQRFGGYIMGTYDTKIQHIANSTTMETVSSSLAIALTDFEASQSRSVLLGLGFASANKGKEFEQAIVTQPESPPPSHHTRSRLRDAAMNRISGQCLRGDDDSTVASHDDENPCANTPITRLQFVVSSIFGLREAARLKSIPFEHFSSRLFMISTGPNVADDGLEGCSRETLDFLRSYQPDAIYSLDLDRFYASLKTWGAYDCIGDVMVATLAACSKGYNLTTLNRTRFRRHVASSMSIIPLSTWGENGIPPDRATGFLNVVRLNAASTILYLANYYCIVPTAHLFSKSLDSSCSAAVLIGAANFSSILGLVFQSLFASKRKSLQKRRLEIADFRLPLTLCSIFALVGNILFSHAIKKSSFGMAIAGRLLIGFGSAELLNRQLLSTIMLRESINTEVAWLAMMTMIIIPLSIVLGSIAGIEIEETPTFMIPLLTESIQSLPSSTSLGSDTPSSPPYRLAPSFFPFRQRGLFSLESVGYVMAVAWSAHLFGMLFFFDIPETKRKKHEPIKSHELQYLTTQEEDFDSDNEEHDSSKRSNQFVSTKIGHGDGTFEKLQAMSRKTVKHHNQLNYSECIANVRQLMFSNVAFPTTVAILFVVKMANEILLSSCGTITSRYFDWSGARSGVVVGIMASVIFPVNLSLATKRNLSERDVTKTALRLARLGLLLLVNYESIFMFVLSIYSGRLKNGSQTYYYDGCIGIAQYWLGFTMIYLSMVTLESVTLTLMSKVQSTPRQIKKFTIDNSFVVILESAIARGVGDLMIYTFDVSSGDIVNCLAFSLLIACTAGIYVVKKHYFFLR